MQQPIFRKESARALALVTTTKKTDTPLERFGSDVLFDPNLFRIISDYSKTLNYQKMRENNLRFRMDLVQEAFSVSRVQRMIELFQRDNVDPLTAFSFMN